ncbi:MAG: hypothetical protein A2287_06490 [Candidatus Melainabacteria bacterium RIFOXYA12_FULL_32_12]|nr:MAG: hypothetical protein A2255_04685 [Candidatus Melainabacteria bacterium RIFOXYA2_FULL_32_9]OGI26328.1 MAG: hypothetical protein A2287_06490 [Candidatus Melainabacteria bacterium RIFOXYA12_FULL_32_12]
MENKATSTPLRYISDHPDFQGFVKIVAAAWSLPAGTIEKDYWVIRVLRELQNSEFQDEFVFKGGTCLSKAYKIIERFSEDIDLLFIQTVDTISKNSKRRRLEKLKDFVASISGLTYLPEKSMVKKLAATIYFDYNKNPDNKLEGEVSSQILLEPGYRGGTSPRTLIKPINSFVGDYLIDKGFQDLAEDIPPFDVKVLCLERIFAEKLCAVKSLHDNRSLKLRTRHYYDLFNLLTTPDIKNLVKNKDELTLILQDISDISEEHFNTEKITLQDIQLCDAFNPEHNCIKELANSYKDKRSKELYYNTQPEFGHMITEISGFLKLL